MSTYHMIEKRRGAEDVANAIQNIIVEMGLREGEKLPSQASLAKELNVSLALLREGLQMLATIGVLEIRHGLGMIVKQPKFSDYLRLFNPRFVNNPWFKGEIIQVRKLLEPYVIDQLAQKKNFSPDLDEVLDRMTKACRQGDMEEFCEEYLRFNRRLARNSGNRLVAEILNVVNRLLFSQKEMRSFLQRDADLIVQQLTELLHKLLKRGKINSAKQLFARHLALFASDISMSIVYDSIETGSIGGSFYYLGRQLCNILYNYSGIPISPEPTGGGIDNVRLTSEGRAILGITQADVAFNAFHGKGMFNRVYDNLRAVCSANKLDLWIVASKASGVYSLKDLRGKRLAVGSTGGDSKIIANAVLDVYGYRPGDYRPYYLSISNAVEAMKKNEIDVIFYLYDGLGTALNELADDIDIRLLPVENPYLEKIQQSHYYWQLSCVDSHSLRYLEKDVPTLGVPCLIVTHQDVPQDVIYTIVETIVQHGDEIRLPSEESCVFSLEKVLNGVNIPLHEGAERYYREKGLL